MTDHVQVRKAKEKVELEYDALITKQTRCQGQLSAKAAQAQKLNPNDYRQWLTDKKAEMVGIQTEIQVKKAERAEARRLFNSWAPPVKEKWIDWPDEEGFWWYARPGSDIEIYLFVEDEESNVSMAGEEDEHYQDGLWKYQQEPELP